MKDVDAGAVTILDLDGSSPGGISQATSPVTASDVVGRDVLPAECPSSDTVDAETTVVSSRCHVQGAAMEVEPMPAAAAAGSPSTADMDMADIDASAVTRPEFALAETLSGP